jgi:hypothetical protein
MKPRYERFICAADNHGDQCDPKAIAAFLAFCKSWKPTYRVHLGDCFDFRWLRGKASEGERREKITADVDAGIDFIRQFKPTHFITGNHDYRLWRAAASDDGKIADLASYLILDIKDALGEAVIYPYGKRKGVFNMNGTNWLHGYHAGVYAARQCAMIYGNSGMGHVHASAQATVARHDGPVTAHTSAALCLTDLEYNVGQPNTLAHQNGWLYGICYPGKRNQIWHAVGVNVAFVLPSEMRDYAAKD